MFKNNLQAVQLNRNIRLLPAKVNSRASQASNILINFNGSAFAPPRDEEFKIRIDNDIYTKKPQRQGLLPKVLNAIREAFLIPQYDVYTLQVNTPEKDEKSHTISYYA